jgi:hypothetical protein
MLNNIDKNKNPFKVPDNYFESFNKMIMEQLSEEKESKAKIVPLWRRVLPWTAIAAALFGILFSVGLFDKTQVGSDRVLAEKGLKTGQTGVAYDDTDEEDYYLFLQDQVRKAQYREMMNNY